jgi:hypothetical protein
MSDHPKQSDRLIPSFNKVTIIPCDRRWSPGNPILGGTYAFTGRSSAVESFKSPSACLPVLGAHGDQKGGTLQNEVGEVVQRCMKA